MGRRLSTQEFISRSVDVHGKKYDYSRVKYTTQDRKVSITCKEHGEFLQTANTHLQGKGCPRCGGKEKGTSESFLLKVKEVHGEKYDYSSVQYEGIKKKVIIACKNHGDFTQRPDIHLNGHGCPICAKDQRPKSTNIGRMKFIARARNTHGEKYCYDKVTYVNSKTKILITCREHGDFEQMPANHIIGNGCPNCNRKGFRADVNGYLYILKAKVTGVDIMKVGISNKPEHRIKGLVKTTPFDFEVVDMFYGGGSVVSVLERKYHKLLKRADVNGFDGYTEWFLFDQSAIDRIRLEFT